jgi:hypothetical protein
MRVLFHIVVIVPIAALGFASLLIALAIGTMRDALAVSLK